MEYGDPYVRKWGGVLELQSLCGMLLRIPRDQPGHLLSPFSGVWSCLLVTFAALWAL